MPDQRPADAEAERLEQLWRGEFGDAYVERNRFAWKNRWPFWSAILSEFPAQRVLEMGCNVGGNLRLVASHMSPLTLVGMDVNLRALGELRRTAHGIHVACCSARALPFRDGFFDLVFTMAMLIHQPPALLPMVIRDLVRCSRRFVLCGEYYAREPTEVPYRGRRGVLFKRDFGALFEQLLPELVLRKRGFLSRAEGWDDVTYWVFERVR